MTATETETDLALLFDWDVVCEFPGALGHTVGDHAADLYVKYTCKDCGHVVVRSICNELWETLHRYVAVGGKILCNACKKTEPSLDEFTIEGKV